MRWHAAIKADEDFATQPFCNSAFLQLSHFVRSDGGERLAHVSPPTRLWQGWPGRNDGTELLRPAYEAVRHLDRPRFCARRANGALAYRDMMAGMNLRRQAAYLGAAYLEAAYLQVALVAPQEVVSP